MESFITYSTTTGDISGSGVCSSRADMTPLLEPGEAIMEGEADPKTKMVDIATGEVIDRPPVNIVADSTAIADGVDEAVISGISVRAKVMVSGPVFAFFENITDGTLELSFDVPGRYSVAIYENDYEVEKVFIEVSET